MYEEETVTRPAYESGPSTRTAQPTAVIHYTMYLPDGHSISSHETGYPYRFPLPARSVLPGLEQAVASMEIGETRRIQLTPHLAFGDHHADRVLFSAFDAIRTPAQLQPGMPVRLSLGDDLHQAFVREIRSDGIVFDLNHPLSGLEITVDVTLLAVE